MLMEKLKQDRITAMKARDSAKATFLGTLYADAAAIGKKDGQRETTDEEVVKVIKKYIAGAEETIQIGEKMGRDTSKSKWELAIMAEYLPKQMTEAELKAAVGEIVAGLAEKSPKAMGVVMAEIKAKYAGQYDGKMASAIVKSALQ